MHFFVTSTGVALHRPDKGNTVSMSRQTRKHRWALAATLAILTGAMALSAEPTATAPSGADAATASAPTPAIDPEIERLLERLEKKGDQITDVEADITYVRIDPVLEDRQEYRGIIRFKEDRPNPVFFIRFDSFRQEGIVRKSKQWHVFDGQWYIEARESTRTIVKRQIVRPGETLEVFRIGEGPFPLPFGQKKNDILTNFAVRRIAPPESAPPNCDHIECTPLPGTPLADKYDAIRFSIDRALDLPVRVSTTEKQEGIRITALLDNVKINPGLAASALKLPDLSGYQIDTEPLPPPPPDDPPENDTAR